MCEGVCPTSVPRGAKSSEILVTVSICGPGSYLNIPQRNELWILNEMVESEAGVRKIQDEPGISCSIRI